MIKFRCSECQQRLKVPDEAAGLAVRCPKCRAHLTVPPPSATRGAADEDGHAAEYAVEEMLARPSMEIDREELIDMTAMVDIVFFLLIFFLVTSMSAIQSSAPLPRPETQDEENGVAAQRPDEPKNDSDAIVVKINKDDSMEIDGVPYREIGDLIVRLRQLRVANGADASLLVVGHGEASHGAAVAVLDSGYEVGFDRLRLAVQGDGAE